MATTCKFIKWDELATFLEVAINHYEESAPTVAEYLDDLYVRINEGSPVDLSEIRFLQRINENAWMSPSYAANQVLHLMNRLGMDTTGQLGF